MSEYIRRHFLKTAAAASTVSALAALGPAASTSLAGDGDLAQNSPESPMRRYGTLAALLAAAKPTDASAAVVIDGYHKPGDGGGGVFHWDAGGTEPPDGGMVLTPDADGAGRWRRSTTPFSSTWANVRWFGAQGDGDADDTAAIQAACIYAAQLRGTVFLPNGQYRTTRTIYTFDPSARPGSTACGLAGEGMFSSRIRPAGDFTAVWLVSGYMDQGGFSIEWPATARGSIPSARIGFEVADSTHMVSQCRIHDILVMYAYQSMRHRDWTSARSGRGTAYVIDYERIISFRAADWGFYVRPARGSATTHRFSTCWANCSDHDGEAGGKGFWISGVNDIVMTNCAVDKCKDRAIRVGDGTTGRDGSLSGYQFTAIGTALESCLVSTPSVPLIDINGPPVANLIGIKEIATTVRLPRASDSASAVFSDQDCVINLEAYCRSALNQVSGTLYKVGLDSGSTCIDCDRSILFSEASDNGWYTQISWGGTRYSSSGKAPSQGTNQRGDYVRNMKVSAGQPLGWHCTVGGSPGMWIATG